MEPAAQENKREIMSDIILKNMNLDSSGLDLNDGNQEGGVISRRNVLIGSMASASLLALPGCESLGGFSLVDAIRRILTLSSSRAFARLTGPDGYWDEAIGQLGLDSFLGSRGNVLAGILTSVIFKSRIEDAFADIAKKGARRAAPAVADAVRVIGISNAVALIQGGPTAATGFLRQNMGGRLIDVMVPEIGDGMRIAQEPLVGQLLADLTGVDVSRIASSFSNRLDDTIWREIGAEESIIRANPRATNDPLLMGVLAGQNLL